MSNKNYVNTDVNNVKNKKDRIRIGVLRHSERKAEWLGNDNRKTMIKVKTTGQILPSKSGTALPSPAQAPGWACRTLFEIMDFNYLLNNSQSAAKRFCHFADRGKLRIAAFSKRLVQTRAGNTGLLRHFGHTFSHGSSVQRMNEIGFVTSSSNLLKKTTNFFRSVQVFGYVEKFCVKKYRLTLQFIQKFSSSFNVFA